MHIYMHTIQFICIYRLYVNNCNITLRKEHSLYSVKRALILIILLRIFNLSSVTRDLHKSAIYQPK